MEKSGGCEVRRNGAPKLRESEFWKATRRYKEDAWDDLSDKLRKNKELRFLLEVLPKILEKELEKAATSSKAKTPVECVAFLLKFLWIWQKTEEEKWWNSWRRWSSVGDGRKLAQRCFPPWFAGGKVCVPKGLRWQRRYRVGCDATDGRNGGAKRTVWETLLEVVRCDCVGSWPGEQIRPGQCYLYGLVRLKSICPGKSFVYCAATSNTSGASITAIHPGSMWSCLLLRKMFQDALSVVPKTLSAIEIRSFCEWHHSIHGETRS